MGWPHGPETVGRLASRWGIASILVLFITGAILFYFVDEDKGKSEIAYLAASQSD